MVKARERAPLASHPGRVGSPGKMQALRESAFARVQFPRQVAPPWTPNGWNLAVGRACSFDGVASVLCVSSRAA